MKIIWLERAVIDIGEAYDFIMLDNPAAAESEIDKILEAVQWLPENPMIGKAGRVAKTRELVIAGTPYIVIYRVRNDSFEILRILHGARQWPKKKRK